MSLLATASRAAGRPRPVSRSARRPSSRRRARSGLLFVAPALALVAVFFFVPLVMMLWISLHTWPLFGRKSWVGLANYRAILGDGTFLRSLGFTLRYTVVVVPLLLVVGLVLALLVRESRRGVGLFRTVYFAPYVIGFASASYLWLWFIDPDVGSLDKLLRAVGLGAEASSWTTTAGRALVAVVLLVVWKTVGFSMILLMAGMQQIPGEVNEAATMDGAGYLASLWHVTLPLIRRYLGLIMVMSTTSALLAFDQFYIITSGGPKNGTLTTVFWIFDSSFDNFQLGYGSALSFVLTIVVLIISLVQLTALRERSDSRSRRKGVR
jgi:multiple sugar transport system permease protein